MIIERGPIDHMIFESAKEDYEEVQVSYEKGKSTVNAWPEVYEDIWTGLYKVDPKVKEDSQPEPITDVFQELINSKPWNEIKQKTAMNTQMSSIASALLSEDFLKSIPKKIKEYEEIKRRFEELKKSLKGKKLDEKEKQDLKDLFDKLKNKRDKLDQDSENIKQQFRMNINDKLEETAQTVDGVNELVGSEGKELNQEDIKELFQLLKNNHSLEKLVQILGRIKNILISSKFTKKKRAPDEIYEIKTGNDLRNVLPSELLHLCNPATEVLFAHRYCSEQLLQYSKKTKKIEGKGPIICCVDESGSTDGGIVEWEKALTIAVTKAAQKEKRDVFWVSFSDRGDSKTWHIPKGEYTIPELVDFVKHFFCGGTDYETGFDACLQILKTKTGKADVLFITDGGDPSFTGKKVDRVKREFGERESRIFSICINGYFDILVSFSNAVYNLTTDNEDIVLDGIFGEIF